MDYDQGKLGGVDGKVINLLIFVKGLVAREVVIS
jgi:hypothetical protein